MSATYYFDNNATTRVAPEVVQAMLVYLTERYGNPSSVHRFGQLARQGIDEARAQIPALLKLKPDISVREADRYYAMWCFDADFRDRMVKALRLAGLREAVDENRLGQDDDPAPPSQR